MKKTNQVLMLLSIMLLSSNSYAQQTGDFQLSIVFPQVDYNFTRSLYYHVPTNYDPTQSYKLVVGYRGGPHVNAGEFRDQLSFLSDSIGAIILCPENEGHFWNQEGLTKQLFNYSLDTTLALYNIDTNFIYLTGLSYGGRHSVIVSMDTDSAPIPNLRGVIPFAAGSDSHLEPDYVDIAAFPPACICIGLNDSQTFIDVSNTIHDDIQANSGISMLNEIPGVGHTVAFSTYPDEMMECFNFIEASYGTSSIEEIELKKDLILSPNPANGNITVHFQNEKSIERVEIYSISGELALSFDYEIEDHLIDVSTLKSGVYFLKGKSISGDETGKFIIK